MLRYKKHIFFVLFFYTIYSVINCFINAKSDKNNKDLLFTSVFQTLIGAYPSNGDERDIDVA